MSTALREAVRGLRVVEPGIGVKPLLAGLRAQQPDLKTGSKEVREALTALKVESEAESAAAADVDDNDDAPPAINEGGAPSHAEPSLACVGCARMPSEMGDGREKHPVCPKCVKLKLPTTYFCSVECPGNPVAWNVHAKYHKTQKSRCKIHDEGGGVSQQRNREVAEEQARLAAQTGDEYNELLSEGLRYTSKLDYRRSARAYREVIALRPDEPEAYYSLGAVLTNSGHKVEAAQSFLGAIERLPVGSKLWARATAWAFDLLRERECDEVATPAWWNDEGLKALSARVVRAAPNGLAANTMRAVVLSGLSDGAWELGPRSAAELREVAAHFERAAALCDAPPGKAELARLAGVCAQPAHPLGDAQ